MEWIKIPDHLVLEANGYSWTEENNKVESDAPDAEPKQFHLRYAYSMVHKNLYVDIIEDQGNSEKRTVFQTGIADDPETFHFTVAAIEKTFPTSNIIKTGDITTLAVLLDLYDKDRSSLVERYLSSNKSELQDAFALLFSAYKYARKIDSADPNITEKFANVVRVDFKSGKRAYKPDDDLLEQIRGAIRDLSEDDSPINQGLGTPKP